MPYQEPASVRGIRAQGEGGTEGGREEGRVKEYKQLIRKEGGDWAWKDCNETGGGGRLEAIQWQGARRGVCCRQGAKAGDTVICVLSVH